MNLPSLMQTDQGEIKKETETERQKERENYQLRVFKILNIRQQNVENHEKWEMKVVNPVIATA